MSAWLHSSAKCSSVLAMVSVEEGAVAPLHITPCNDSSDPFLQKVEQGEGSPWPRAVGMVQCGQCEAQSSVFQQKCSHAPIVPPMASHSCQALHLLLLHWGFLLPHPRKSKCSLPINLLNCVVELKRRAGWSSLPKWEMFLACRGWCRASRGGVSGKRSLIAASPVSQENGEGESHSCQLGCNRDWPYPQIYWLNLAWDFPFFLSSPLCF